MINAKKRIIALLMTALMLVGIVPITAFAADVTMDLSKAEVSWDYTLTDLEGNAFSAAYGLNKEDNPFGYAMSARLHKMHDYTTKRPGLGSDKSQWIYGQDFVYCFCIEHGIPLPDSGDYAGSDDPTHGNKYEMLSAAQKDLLALALTYGYPNRTDLQTSKDANACYSATQLIVWQITLGFRTSPTELNDKAYPMSGYTGTMTEQYCRNPYLKDFYDRILTDMANHFKRPSFTSTLQSSAPVYDMKFENGKYSVTLTDTNGVLGNFYVSSSGGVSTSISGNTLTISSSTPINGDCMIKLNRRIPSTNHTTGFLIWSVPGKENANQDMVSGVPANNDPVPAYLQVKAPAGHLKIIKTSEDGKVSGIRFQVTGNGIDKSVTTGSNGEILLENLQSGIYSVSEDAIDRYNLQNTQRVTVVSGQTATVYFNNTLRRGDLRVVKTSVDKFVEDVTFRLSGTSLSGLPVNLYVKTDASGVALFEDVLIGSDYVLEEIDTAERYVVPAPETVTVEWNKVTEKSVHNVLKKFRVTVLKSDAETGYAQGDGQLGSATYGLFKGNQMIASYQTDANGAFTSDWFVCADDWTLREISPSTGYLLDFSEYHVGAEPGKYKVEYSELTMNVTEIIKESSVSIIKHCDDGSTQIETPESGAQFQIYLKTAGSFDNARESERDTMTCDEYGFCQSKNLPYGTYIVHQTAGWEGKEFIKDFEVFISENEKTYRFLINNSTFESDIQIVKVDAESGKVIPAASVGFRIKNVQSGEFITQHIKYPTPTDISVFYTSPEGKLMLPQPLPFGDYELWEENSCEGYVLSKEPISFKVDGTKELVEVKMPNVPQKGKIIIKKTGEVFSSVKESDGFYRPVYALDGLAGAEHQIIALEDIYTPDGTLRHAKDEVVDTIVTSSSGEAESKLIYPGLFQVLEVKAPSGMVLNTEPKYVTINYADETVEVVFEHTSFRNERQKVIISLLKELEQDGTFGIGTADEYTKVRFGLYVAEPLRAADGTEIPKDGLLEVIGIDENGLGVFTADVPVGAKLYVKEYATDEHYLISDTAYPVEFDYQGEDVATVQIVVNDGGAIGNTIIRGNIEGMKTDEDGAPVAKTVFGLFKPDETVFTTDNALATAESGENGQFSFAGVPYGKWLLKELACPEQYVLSEEIIEVTISEQDQVIELKVVNEIIYGCVEGLKVDDKENPVSGALFGLFKADETVFSAETALALSESSEKGLFRFADLRYGKYLIKELSCGEEFVMCEDTFEVDINTDGQVISLTITNKRIIGKVQVIKISSKDHERKLSGAEFEIYLDVNGNKVFDPGIDTLYGKLSETELGVYELDGLTRGGYLLFESKAPEGFQKDDRYFYFKIVSDGEVITIENERGVGFVNEPVPTAPDEPSSPQTGDNSHIRLWILLASGSLAGIIAITLVGREKRKSL